MSSTQATHAQASESCAPATPAVRPVTIAGRALTVTDHAIPTRVVTSIVPFGPVEPAPVGQSIVDRVLRRALIEVVRTVLFVAFIVTTIALTTGQAAAWPVRTIARRVRRARGTSRVVSLR